MNAILKTLDIRWRSHGRYEPRISTYKKTTKETKKGAQALHIKHIV